MIILMLIPITVFIVLSKVCRHGQAIARVHLVHSINADLVEVISEMGREGSKLVRDPILYMH